MKFIIVACVFAALAFGARADYTEPVCLSQLTAQQLQIAEQIQQRHAEVFSFPLSDDYVCFVPQVATNVELLAAVAIMIERGQDVSFLQAYAKGRGLVI